MSKHKTNIVITGLMGTGKTTVAKLVAEKLGQKWVDTDTLIEAQTGKSISQLFEFEGECAFREQEKKLCKELASQSGLVISTGGGTLVPFDNFAQFRGRASIFCLLASDDTVARRLSGTSERPLLSNANNDAGLKARIRQLAGERQASLNRIFHHIDTDNETPESVSEQILTRLNGDRHFANSLFVQVQGDKPYPICLRPGVLEDLSSVLNWLGLSAKQIAIVASHPIWHLYGMRLAKHLDESGFKTQHCTIPDGESFKTLDTIQKIYDQFLTSGLKRGGVVLSLGGGVTGDLTGFAAATYMRGVHFIQIPTTLLAMVDASVGGKTGVDLPQGKNLVGAFKQPLAVIIDPNVLKSLSLGEFRAGMAEVVKHAIIGDPRLFERVDQMEIDDFTGLIRRALQIKINIVEQDPFEKNIRAHLNLGHTFAHAIERCKNYQIRHGEAVAIGLVAAAKLAHLLHKNDGSLLTRVEHVLEKLRLPIRLKDVDAVQIYDAMGHDKKSNADTLRFIVPLDIGRIEICDDVTKLHAIEAIQYICG